MSLSFFSQEIVAFQVAKVSIWVTVWSGKILFMYLYIQSFEHNFSCSYCHRPTFAHIDMSIITFTS